MKMKRWLATKSVPLTPGVRVPFSHPRGERVARRRPRSAQVTIEFAFCLIIVAVLVYGLVRAFRWAGLDLAERRAKADESIMAPIDEDWQPPDKFKTGPPAQLKTTYYRTNKMGLVFNNW